MTFDSIGRCSRCNYMPCRCLRPCPGGSIRPQAPTGPQGPTGPAGPATIPFSVSEYGVELGTDAQGNPQIVYFSGFGPRQYGTPIFLQEGEWATGTITFRPDMSFGTAFIMPYSAVLKKIYVLFSSKLSLFLEPGSIVYPFVCLATSNSTDLVYTILQDTITYTEPYMGDVEYPKHTLRRGALTNLNIPISEGTLVAIVTGIRGENVTSEQLAQFTTAGGLYFE